jgi:hypothetical protein
VPTTVAAGLAKFQQNLEITDLQASTVSIRQQNVRDAVEKEMDVLDSFLAGSYMRNTLIAPLKSADVDVFVILDPKYWSDGGQANLLDQVKRVVKKTYPNTPEISRNGQAVTITFTDFKVDLVPTFYREGGGYLIPDSHRSAWIATDPKAHIKLWADANKAHNSDLIPLIKMLKGWNKNQDVMSSFALETVTMKVLDGIRIDDYPSGVRYVFDTARAKVKAKIPDPAGYSDDVAADITVGPKMDAVVSALETAHTRALAAEDFVRRGKIEDAFGRWRLIFGDYFPAYG